MGYVLTKPLPRFPTVPCLKNQQAKLLCKAYKRAPLTSGSWPPFPAALTHYTSLTSHKTANSFWTNQLISGHRATINTVPTTDVPPFQRWMQLLNSYPSYKIQVGSLNASMLLYENFSDLPTVYFAPTVDKSNKLMSYYNKDLQDSLRLSEP